MLLFIPEKEAQLGRGQAQGHACLSVVDLGPAAPPLIHLHPSSSSLPLWVVEHQALAFKVPEHFLPSGHPARALCLPTSLPLRLSGSSPGTALPTTSL